MTWAVETEKPFTIPLPVTPEVVLAAGLDTGASEGAPYILDDRGDVERCGLFGNRQARSNGSRHRCHARFQRRPFTRHTQGAILIGAISEARSSRSFGRSGTLRFSFHQIVLPSRRRANGHIQFSRG